MKGQYTADAYGVHAVWRGRGARASDSMLEHIGALRFPPTTLLSLWFARRLGNATVVLIVVYGAHLQNSICRICVYPVAIAPLEFIIIFIIIIIIIIINGACFMPDVRFS